VLFLFGANEAVQEGRGTRQIGSLIGLGFALPKGEQISPPGKLSRTILVNEGGGGKGDLL
jgi:hypothetical protein